MLGVKLDVNWCSDNLREILVNNLSLHCTFHLIQNTFNHACTSINRVKRHSNMSVKYTFNKCETGVVLNSVIHLRKQWSHSITV